MRTLPPDVLQRVDQTPSNGCWQWTVYVGRDGYGRSGSNGIRAMAHRLVYELLVGHIPEGMTLDHLCRIRACVNPLHMEVVTGQENARRSMSAPAVNARKTACIHGHEFTPENTYVRPDGTGRYCKECRRQRCREYMQKIRANRKAA